MPEQWPRALLRAQLREQGYDAVGARDFTDALAYAPEEPDRGRIGLVLVDQAALEAPDRALRWAVLDRYGHPVALLLARAGYRPAADEAWRKVVHRPVSIAALVREVRGQLPLAPGRSRPVE